MGIVGRIIRYSIPAGVLYVTIQSELWAPGAGDELYEKQLERQRLFLRSNTNALRETIDTYVPGKPAESSVTKIRSLCASIPPWNCMVRYTFQSLASMDLMASAKKALESLNSTPESGSQKQQQQQQKA